MAGSAPPDERRMRLVAMAGAVAHSHAAVEAITSTTRCALLALPADHDVIRAIEAAEVATKIAMSKLEIALRRTP